MSDIKVSAVCSPDTSFHGTLTPRIYTETLVFPVGLLAKGNTWLVKTDGNEAVQKIKEEVSLNLVAANAVDYICTLLRAVLLR